MLKKFEKKLVRLEEEFVIFSMLFLVLLQVLQVLFRYVIKNPLAWVDETSRFLLVWMTMIGSAHAVYKLAHFSVAVLVERFPPKLKKFNYAIVTVINVALIAILLYYGLVYLESSRGQVSPAMGIPIEILNIAVPIGIFLMLFHLILNIGEDPENKREQIVE